MNDKKNNVSASINESVVNRVGETCGGLKNNRTSISNNEKAL